MALWRRGQQSQGEGLAEVVVAEHQLGRLELAHRSHLPQHIEHRERALRILEQDRDLRGSNPMMRSDFSQAADSRCGRETRSSLTRTERMNGYDQVA